MRKKITLCLTVGFLILIAAGPVLVSCSPFLQDQRREEFDGTVRESVDAETPIGPITLAYLRSQTAAPQRVIYVHGTPGDASGWLNYVRNPVEGTESYAVDRPGFGMTLPMRAVTGLDAQAASLLPLLDVPEGAPKPILLGHSLGGPVVAAVAANYPDRISGIVVAAGSLDPDLEEVLWVQYLGLVPPFSWLISYTADHANKELVALEGELKALKAKLDRITVPVVIVHGTDDDLVPYDNVPFMQSEFVNAARVGLITLDGQNHFLPWNSEAELRAAVLSIMTREPAPQEAR